MAASNGAPLDRQGLQIMSEDECWERLRETPVGRIAFVEAGEPWILPMNHVVVAGRVAFLTAPGTKLGAAMMAEPVGYEVDQYDLERRTGWSVLVRGHAEPVYDELLRRELDASGLVPWASAKPRNHWVHIRPTSVTGRRLERS